MFKIEFKSTKLKAFDSTEILYLSDKLPTFQWRSIVKNMNTETISAAK